MSYTYERGAADYMKISTADGQLYIEMMNETRGSYPSTNIIVPNTDAPRIALEILKAASPGPAELSDMADAKSALRRVVKHYEANALDKRRAEVCKELGAAFVPAAADTALKRAIDRIIELESQK